MTDEKIIRRLRWLADAWEAGDVVECKCGHEWSEVTLDINFEHLVYWLHDDDIRIKPRPYVRWQNEYRTKNGKVELSTIAYSSFEDAQGESMVDKANYVRTVRMVEASDEDS